ncbi:hypothetical protein BGX27_003972, partial [Mortierella sp. AM989]
YQAHSPIREIHTAYPPSAYNYYSRHGSSEEVHELHPHSREGGILTDEHPLVLMPPPSIGQREDHYRQSPTLTASQTLAASYGSRPESPYQSYLPYQPYSAQHGLPSPLILDMHRSNTTYSSPGLGPLHTSHTHEERSEHKADPYRSAYSQSISNHHGSIHGHPYGSPYLGSGSGSPNLNEDFSSSFESKLSVVSSQQNQSNNNGSNNPRYPMRDLAGQDSTQPLTASSQELASQQQQQQQEQEEITTVSNKTAGPSLDKNLPTAVAGHTKKSAILPSQPSKTDSSDTKKAKTEEDEENDVILQKLGVLTADSSNGGKSRSGMTCSSSGRSRRKGQWTDESEDDSQGRRGGGRRRIDHERARRRRRDDQGRCCCCTTRVCILITLGIFASMAVALYFLLPRAPLIRFESATSSETPMMTNDRIRGSFSVQLFVDNYSNYVPIRLNSIDMIVSIRPEKAMIANNKGISSSVVFEPRTRQVISIPMMLDYRSKNKNRKSDDILQELITACTPVDLRSGATSPGIDFTIEGFLHVWGLSWIWKPTFRVEADNIPCPINSRDLPTRLPSTSSVGPVPSVTAIMASVSAVAQGSVKTAAAAVAVNAAVETATVDRNSHLKPQFTLPSLAAPTA